MYYFYTECEAYDPAYPSVTINASHNLVAYVGDDLSIDCVVASWSQSETSFLEWYKNGNEVFLDCASSPASRVCYSESPFDKVHCRQLITVNIKNLAFNDSGYYSCGAGISKYPMVMDTKLITVTVPMKQPNYKSLILEISIPVSMVIILLAICVILITYYYQRKRHIKLQKALEEYQKRRLPKKG